MFMIALQTLETMSSPSWFRRREGEFSTGHMGCWLFSCILQRWLAPFDNTTLHTRRSTGYPVAIKRRNGKSPSFSYHIRYSIFRHTREPSSAPVSFHWQVLRRSMIEARKKRPWAKSGFLWFGGTCMDSWWFKITSEKDEENSYKKFPQLLKKTMASPYSVTSLEWWFIYETFLNGWTCSAIFRIVTDYNSAIDGLQALVSRWFHLGFWPGWTDRCRRLG